MPTGSIAGAGSFSTLVETGVQQENITYSVASPFDGTIVLEKAVSRNPLGAWEPVAAARPNVTFSGSVLSTGKNIFRIRTKPITSNYVSNGEFADTTGWTAGAGWAIADGAATRTASASTPNLDQTVATPLIAGASYRVTFDMTRSAGSLTVSIGGGTASAALTTADATVSVDIVAGSTQVLRFIANATFAGTVTNVQAVPLVTYSLEGKDATVFQEKNSDQKILSTAKQDTRIFEGDVEAKGLIKQNAALTLVDVTAATLVVTTPAHAGRTVKLNRAAGQEVTLPEATGSGDSYTFFVDTTITSNTTTIKCALADDVMSGLAFGRGDAANIFLTAADTDTVTFNGSTTGGILGTSVFVKDVGLNQWWVQVGCNASGTFATPFSSTVS